MTEADIQASVALAIGARPDVRVFRNNTGTAWQGDVTKFPKHIILANPRPVNFGLCVGSPDLVGWRSVTVTPDMVGRTFAVFVGLEIKTPKGRPSDEQVKFINVMTRAGALGGVVRSAEDAKKFLTIE